MNYRLIAFVVCAVILIFCLLERSPTGTRFFIPATALAAGVYFGYDAYKSVRTYNMKKGRKNGSK